jgi:hypothetical protein
MLTALQRKPDENADHVPAQTRAKMAACAFV